MDLAPGEQALLNAGGTLTFCLAEEMVLEMRPAPISLPPFAVSLTSDVLMVLALLQTIALVVMALVEVLTYLKK
jgi:hypothetical protein